MSNFNVKFKKIIEDLEKNIKNPEDLELVKVQIFNLYNLFLDEINKLENIVSEKMTTIAGTQASLEEKVETLQSKINNIEKELYIDEDSDFSITCPYCNYEFTIENDELKDEIQCPECSNIIELEWGDECGCEEHNCGCGCDDCENNHNKENDEDM